MIGPSLAKYKIDSKRYWSALASTPAPTSARAGG